VKPIALHSLLLLLTAFSAIPVSSQQASMKDEIPIERCDRLPVVFMKVDGASRRFLLDTGANSILNKNSFPAGEPTQVRVNSWSGEAPANAHVVSLKEVRLGNHILRNWKLAAIDLSPISKACGCLIDGILGVDLLDQIGLTIDFKRRIAATGSDPTDASTAFAEMEKEMSVCDSAFDEGNVKQLEGCFDPEIILYTPQGEFRGRDEVMHYLNERYFQYAPKLRYEMQPHDVRAFGDALWYSYDYSIDTPVEQIKGHGMSMCRKDAAGHWRMLNMNNSVKEPNQPQPSP
jgi:hypothetical protein